MQILIKFSRKRCNYFIPLPFISNRQMLAGMLLCGMLLLVTIVEAQMPTDTFELAKNLKSEGKLKEASSLLKAYHAVHPKDLNSTWVYAQTMYWLKDFKKAKKLYRLAIAANPANYYLQLDYTNLLAATGKVKQAKTILTAYRVFDSTSIGFKSAIAGLYWLDRHRRLNEVLYRGYLPTSADTLNKVKQFKNNGKNHQACKLLKLYYKAHANNFNTTWLYAQVAYLNKHFKKSKKLYRQAEATHPDNYYLKLDYATMLANIADYNEALPLLNAYSRYDSANTKLELALAKVYLAQGNFDMAEKNIMAVLAQDKQNEDALMLLDELHIAKSSWIKIKGNYTKDSQPLQTITPAVEAGVYLHPEATLKLNLQTPLFISNGTLKNAQWLQAGDVSTFRKAGFQIAFDAGAVKQPYENKISWTGNLELKQILLKHLVLQAQAERKPYYYTISSLDTLIMVTKATAYAEWNDLNNWNGRIAFEYNGFADKNYILGGSGWVFTPPLKACVFEFRIGGAYSFSTSKDNKFVPEKTLSQIIANYSASETITGVYSPYFTPDNMSIVSALGSIVAHPVKTFDIGFNANVGFYSTVLNPYFYLNKYQNGDVYIDEGYGKEKFYPMEFSAYGLVRITKKISLKVDYTYRKTYFYTSNSAGIGLTINFWNEQTRK